MDFVRVPNDKNDKYKLSEFKLVQLEFTPTYNESDKIEGNTPFEIVSNISQIDSLSETKFDSSRCAPSSLLNAFLLMGGKFDDIAKKFGIDGNLTYENVHKVQDSIYKLGNTDGQHGITSFNSYKYIVDIWNPKADGELKPLAEKIGLDVKPLNGLGFNPNFKDNDFGLVNKRNKAVDNFFSSNPQGTIIIGVRLDEDGSLHNFVPNHAVLVFKKDNNFYLANTGLGTNANNSSIKKLSPEEVNELVYSNSSTVFGLTLKK